ncbi:hypothetical protein D6829_01405 [Candidatus Pacearchaeota archaeon]|nr:MAG: hypothetical protein D6829_01405 [Candidatus Pacearchaeota archaeon]
MRKRKGLRKVLGTILAAELIALPTLISSRTSYSPKTSPQRHQPQKYERSLDDYLNEERPLKISESYDVRDYESQIKEMIKRHEGIRYRSYRDSEGHRTIGIGFNLERKDARRRIEMMGYNFRDVFYGRQKLLKKDIEALFEEDFYGAEKVAKKFAGNSWGYLNYSRRAVLIDMAYNLGQEKLYGFKKLRKALQKQNYEKAAEEMVDSKWYRQVKGRAKELVRMMRYGK